MQESNGRRGRCRLVATFASAALVSAVAAVLLAPATASASHLNSGMSVSVGGPVKLVSGVYLRVPVSVTCPVLPAPLTAIFSDSITVSVSDKTGNSLAFGGGGIDYQSPAYNGIGIGTPVTCDGSPHAMTVEVYPQIPDSGPFHGGRAVASAFFGLTVYDPTNPCVFCTADSSNVASGSQSISIRG